MRDMIRLLKEHFNPRRISYGGSGYEPCKNLPSPVVPHPSSLIPHPLPARGGFSLAELMIAMAVITIGVVAAMGSFKYINVALAQSRLKSIATNLAQEKMEVLKNKSYFQLMVTTAPVVSSGFTTNFVYDSNNYPPETITLWGMPALTRAVNVDYASVSGSNISTVPYSYSDPGMKKITVYVFWTDRGENRKVQLDSYYQNPSAATLSAGFRGVIREGGSPAGGVLVQVAGVPKWRGYSDSGGNYSFQVAPGSYTLVCSSAGFFPQTTSTSLFVSDGNYTPKDFSIVRIASGTVGSDSLYAINPSLVISQVVASTVQVSGVDVQYIELFNPTPAPINIGDAVSHSINLNFTSKYPSPDQVCTDIPLTYVSTFAVSGGYYLIANTSGFTVNGLAITADAYYTDTANTACSNTSVPGYLWLLPYEKPILMYNRSGTVWLTDSSGSTLDAVGWTNNSAASIPGQCETGCISLPGGLNRNDQLVRFSTPCAVGTSYGRAYDSGDNLNNFYYNTGVAVGINYRPFSSASPKQAVLSGVPALSAYVFADDGNSYAVRSSSGYVTGPQGQTCPYSSFTIVGVSTGVWKVTAIYGDYLATISSVTVLQNVSTSVPNGITVSSWPVSGFSYMLLSSTYTGGLASGYVYGAGPDYWTRLGGKRVGSSDGNYTTTDSQGWYFLPVSTGTAVITANYNSNDGNYTTSDNVATILQGVVSNIPDFHLAKGGYLKGYVTSGTGAIPNIPVRASNGGPVYEDTTDSTGYFYIFAATSSVAYTVTPELDPLQGYTSVPSYPLVSSVTTAGATVFAGTITVIGALGTISGSVSYDGAPITTGVLVVASTAAVPSPLNTIYASSAPAQAILYSVSSKSDGTYSLEVRSSTTSTYYVRAFYPVVDVKTGSVSYTSKSSSTISVGAGAEVTGKNFSWP
ncbi:MAG: hypothetical protein A2X28_04795 [Elusimicrobia bacterium GWA2_56_46]|nr:MAG: hypothetical protein A2X28_04795 [Elusimicrobia bacterium GWA2_56_46]OGR56189.1 MAG: hypothetical protein A2X39_08215 [Elusimicrobia bacterium GWC2_56_31]HBB66906.1 hypothetical protein [Elusimicrobiota bacterium]HBW23034.1 hypothetical protein [Elusimicrobiota bacterium]